MCVVLQILLQRRSLLTVSRAVSCTIKKRYVSSANDKAFMQLYSPKLITINEKRCFYKMDHYNMKKGQFWRYIWQHLKNVIRDACLNENGFQPVGLPLPRSTFAVTLLIGFSILELHNIGHVEGGYLIVARPILIQNFSCFVVSRP